MLTLSPNSIYLVLHHLTICNLCVERTDIRLPQSGLGFCFHHLSGLICMDLAGANHLNVEGHCSNAIVRDINVYEINQNMYTLDLGIVIMKQYCK